MVGTVTWCLRENPTPSPAADPDLLVLHEQAIRREFLDTIDSDDDVSSVYSVCSNCKHPAKKGEDLKRCSRCQITRYSTVAFSARGKIGTFTDLLVRLWPRSQTL